MRPTRMAVQWLVFSVLLACAIGCQKGPPDTPAPLDLSELPYLQQTHHGELRAELARLEAEQATPAQLQQATWNEEGAESGVAAGEQLNEKLETLMAHQHLELALQRLDRIYPTGDFTFDPLRFENAVALQLQFAPQRNAYRQLLGQDDFQFYVSLESGLLADLAFLDHATLAHRLEALGVQESLAAGQLTETLLPLRNMFHITSRLAALPHLAARLAAARLRAEALRVVDAVANHPQATRAILGQLQQLIDTTLAAWSPDALAWIGDRAMGLHTYEMVRDGQLMNILTSDEIKQLTERRNLDVFLAAVNRSVDDDEWFYLMAMRKVIAGCEQPYYQRRQVLDAIDNELADLRDTPRFPLLASSVLLKDLDLGHRTQALDRARCLARSLALAEAAGLAASEVPLNPVTGKPFQLVRGDTLVSIDELDGTSQGEPVAIRVVSDSRRDSSYKSD